MKAVLAALLALSAGAAEFSETLNGVPYRAVLSEDAVKIYATLKGKPYVVFFHPGAAETPRLEESLTQKRFPDFFKDGSRALVYRMVNTPLGRSTPFVARYQRAFRALGFEGRLVFDEDGRWESSPAPWAGVDGGCRAQPPSWPPRKPTYELSSSPWPLAFPNSSTRISDGQAKYRLSARRIWTSGVRGGADAVLRLRRAGPRACGLVRAFLFGGPQIVTSRRGRLRRPDQGRSARETFDPRRLVSLTSHASPLHDLAFLYILKAI